MKVVLVTKIKNLGEIGDVVDGYALVAQISTCNTFAVHKPINKRIYNPRPLNRRKACVR